MAAKNGRKYLKDEDFDEGDVWGVMDDNSSPKLRKPFKISSLYHHASSPSSSISPSSLTNAMGAPRMIPRSSSSSSNVVVSSEKQSSAPVEIPDWSKIYGNPIRKKKNGTISTSWVDYNGVSHDGYYANNNGFSHHHGNSNNNGHHHYLNGFDDDDDNDAMHDDDDDEDDMVPPHEFIARKLARSQISSFSVCEGIGRRLKGRDLSKVRNAILTKTGFLE